MGKIISLEKLMEKIDFLINVYDAIRVVEPIKKKVYYFSLEIMNFLRMTIHVLIFGNKIKYAKTVYP